MDDFTISLAGIPIGIKPFHPEIQIYFSDYFSSESPLFSVAPDKENLEYEMAMFGKRNGRIITPSHDAMLNMELSALLRLIADRIPEYGAILFHGSVVAADGRAYLFTAPSGTGKTTHTRLWLQQLPQAYVLNGDKPFLKLDSDGRVLACGNPWRGKEWFGCSEILPLEAICLLERAPENRICSITPKETGMAFLHQAYIPNGNAGPRAIALLEQISRNVSLYRLGCNMEPEAAQVSIRAMIPNETAEPPVRVKNDA